MRDNYCADLAKDSAVTVFTQEEVTSEELRVDAKVPLISYTAASLQ